jgi:hypothetical protein
MLLPLPITGIWVVNVEPLTDPHRWDPPMAAVFLVLAVVSALIVRVRQRVLKVGALLAIGGIGAVAVAHTIWSELSLFALAVVGLLVLGFAWSPALLKARHDLEDAEPWLEEPEELSGPPACT